MTPQSFIEKWSHNKLSERAGAQQHFLDLCELLGVEKPADPDNYCFERGAKKTGAAHGWADVWKRGAFAWEYKGPGAKLDAALKQLMTYALALDNPPLLVVSDRLVIEIHTHFTGTPSEIHTIALAEIGTPENLKKLGWLFNDPDKFKPPITRAAITLQAAKLIGDLAWQLQQRKHDPQTVAHFLNKIIFCLFAEDAKGPASEPLLPNNLFSTILNNGRKDVARFEKQLKNLFKAMSERHGEFGEHFIQWFNGGLFDDDVTVPLERDDIENLINVAKLDWSSIEPSIFGTLFERGLDPAKRSQLGAHYTDPVSIMRIVNPVIVEPLLAEWFTAKTEIAAQMAVFHQFQSATKRDEKAKATVSLKTATQRYIGFKERLKNFKVLDPACGSGNFLYLALQALKDIELRVGLEAEELGLERGFPEVGPQAMHGIEISPYAAELAKVTVWIGDIQWMLKHGFAPSREPILKTLDQIQCRDALLVFPLNSALLVSPLPPALLVSPLPPGEGPGVREAGALASTSPSSPALLPGAEGSKSIPAGEESEPLQTEEGSKRKINPPLPADLKTHARSMRASPTDAEGFIWGALRARRMAGFKFRRQHPVERFILDFYCHDLQLAIELDGGQHQDNVDYDKARSATLAAGGIRVVRFWNNDVLSNPESVLEAIWNELQLLSPLPPGEGPGVRENGEIASKSPSSPTLLLGGEGSKPVQPTEAIWPRVDAIIGNPPFLGGSKMREELGDEYTEALRMEYAGRVPGGADLVCYWFAKAQACVSSSATRAGLVATNSIRQSTNRPVLERIVAEGEIYNAWGDQEWVNEGAAVRVSIVCFEGNRSTEHRHIERSEISAVVGREETSAADSSAKAPRNDKFLDGRVVAHINADLTGDDVGASALDMTQARPLKENAGMSFQGSQKIGAFDIDGDLAREWLKLPNPHGRPNSDVLKPSWNGMDVTRRPRDGWIIDFGTTMSESEAALYEIPFRYSMENVKLEREKNNRESYRKNWWRHGEPRIAMRAATADLLRYIATPEVAKHRPFVWLDRAVLPDKRLIVIARDDDTTFGILSSRFHVAWALAVGGTLEDRPCYNPTLCFQTFPFPEGLTPNLKPAQYTNPHAAAIATAAARLNQLRENWLNPPEWVEVIPEVLPSPTSAALLPSPPGRGAGGEGNGSREGKPIRYPDRIIPKPEFAKAIKDRTLTNLYNARAEGEVQWLADAHHTLDAAVAAAYGWADYSAAMADEEILRRLLALNLARSVKEPSLIPGPSPQGRREKNGPKGRALTRAN